MQSLRSGIFSTANALGMDPLDLATIISYETAGTFDPTKAGPTTQWGQHRGLIQFGQPQAKQYGVDFSSPDAAMATQFGPDGAIVRYYKDAGWKPGMGMLDAYSAVNAGRVGRYNASDANNGGAPGTVRDKVEKQMGPHRAKAMALLGNDYQPSPQNMQPAGGPQMTGLLGSIPQMTPFQPPKDERKFTEKLRDGAADGSLWDALAVGFNTLRMDPDEGLAQAAQRRMAGRQQDARANATADWLRQNGREDLAAAIQAGADPSSAVQVMMQGSQQSRERNATAEWMRANGREDLANAIEAGVIDGAAAFKAMQPEAQDQTAAMQNYQAMIDMGVPQDQAMERAFGGGGVNVTVNSGSEVGTIPQGYELFTDPETGARSMRPVVGGPEDTSKADAKKEQNNSTATEVITSAAGRAREAAAQRQFGGFGQGVAAQLPWTDSAEVARQVEVLKSNAKVENLQAMRAASPTGGALGAVSDSENAMLAAKAGALDPSSPTFLRDLDDYERTLLRIVHGKDAGDAIFSQTRQMQDGPTDDDLLKKYGG